jgi:DNA-binding IclR family transcriptional regulator
MKGIFCEIFGGSIRSQILEFILTFQSGDFAVSDIAEEVKISRPKAYEYSDKFEKQGYISKSRVIGRTQLYKLNKEHKHVKLLMRTFNDCLQLIVDEHTTKKNHADNPSSVGAVSAKNV